MIEVICEDGIFKAKGSFSFGIAGTFANKDFDGEMISFDEDTLDQILESDDFFVEPLLPFIKSEAPDEIAKGLAEYYNQKEREIASNVKEINDCVLFHIFNDLEACSYPFWEIKEAVLPGYLEDCAAEEYSDVVYCHTDGIMALDKYYDGIPNNGTVEKPDVEAMIRRLYPMFNLDGFIKSLKPECLYFNGGFMSFQFSDGWGKQLACAAYDELDENFTFTDWHNY